MPAPSDAPSVQGAQFCQYAAPNTAKATRPAKKRTPMTPSTVSGCLAAGCRCGSDHEAGVAAASS